MLWRRLARPSDRKELKLISQVTHVRYSRSSLKFLYLLSFSLLHIERFAFCSSLSIFESIRLVRTNVCTTRDRRDIYLFLFFILSFTANRCYSVVTLCHELIAAKMCPTARRRNCLARDVFYNNQIQSVINIVYKIYSSKLLNYDKGR